MKFVKEVPKELRSAPCGKVEFFRGGKPFLTVSFARLSQVKDVISSKNWLNRMKGTEIQQLMYREVYISSVVKYYTPLQPLCSVRVLGESKNIYEDGIPSMFPCSSCVACCNELDETQTAATSGTTNVFFAGERLRTFGSFGLELKVVFL